MLIIKTNKNRVVEATDYIKMLNIPLGTQLYNSMRDSRSMSLSREVSLGRPDEGSIPADKRVALRALLLCQRYYFGRLSRGDWKEASLAYWKNKSKTEINRAILLFTAPCKYAAKLATVAQAAGGAPGAGSLINFRFSRADNEPLNIGNGTCYIAIMVWMLKAGLVSYQWFAKHALVKSVAGLKASFGNNAQRIWQGTTRFTAADSLPIVQRGHIVHMYDERAETFGHWMVSLGDGLAVGCNNIATAAAPVVYSNNASLNNQFLLGFNQGNGQFFQRGVADVYDPTGLSDNELLYM